MTEKYDGLAEEILKNIGGRDNVISFTHCITRLRFKLKDASKADIDALRKNNCIFKVMEETGQLQLAVGGNVNVNEVYAAVCNAGRFNERCSSEVTGVYQKNRKIPHTTLPDRISSFLKPNHGSTKEKEDAAGEANAWEVIIDSPLTGEVKALSESEDEVFASGALGHGVTILPAEGKVVAPCDGVISSFFSTGHAICITSDNGAEILIHIGMNTVNLGDRYFTPKAKEGDRIRNGQLLIEFDAEGIKNAGYSLATPVIITNPDAYRKIVFETGRHITRGSRLFTLLLDKC